MIEHKVSQDARLKIADVGSFGQLSGYASTWANWDRVKERPVRGAFLKSLPDFLRDGFISVGHDWDGLPVATVTSAYEDDIGLFLEADFHSTPFAQEARTIAKERLDRGKSVGLSIGYEVMDDEVTDEGRLLKEVFLYETSLVSVPANPLATVTGVKSLLEASMSIDSHSDVVEAAIQGYVKRLGNYQGARVKEGRVLSGANRTKLSNLHESLADVMAAIEELLQATEPKANQDEVRKALAQYLVFEARRQGVLR